MVEFAGWDTLLMAINVLVIQLWVALLQLFCACHFLSIFSPAVKDSEITLSGQNVCLMVAIKKKSHGGVQNKDREDN